MDKFERAHAFFSAVANRALISAAGRLKRVHAAVDEEACMRAEEDATLRLLQNAYKKPRKGRGANAIRASFAYGDWSNPLNNRSWERGGVTHNLELYQSEICVSKQLFDYLCTQVHARLRSTGNSVRLAIVSRRIAVLLRYLH